jgi:hypothetical protein
VVPLEVLLVMCLSLVVAVVMCQWALPCWCLLVLCLEVGQVGL